MFGTYTRLRVSVWASDIAVIRAARRKLAKAFRTPREHRKARHDFYRTMLRYHHSQQGLCVEWRM